MSESKKDSTKATDFRFVDILKGRIPDFKDSTRYYITLIAVLAFWVFLVWKISPLISLIPGMSYFFPKKGQSS